VVVPEQEPPRQSMLEAAGFTFRSTVWPRRRTPPGWVFYGCCLVVALIVLWAQSWPGGNWSLEIAGGLLTFGLAFVWVIRLLLAGTSPWTSVRRLVRWAIGPAGSVVLAVVLSLGLPLRARWTMSEDAFNRAVAEIQQHPERAQSFSGRIGYYDITIVRVVERGVLFYDSKGAFIDDAGFAFLPDGPYPELENGGFERPAFRHLGGPWYSWIASW
jgi:hypothetical protein